MKLLVIGHSVVDRIQYKGLNDVKPGGIHYSIAALSSYAEVDDEIFLCSSLSKKSEYLFTPFYDKINKKYISYVEEIPEVFLKIKDDEERDETYCRISNNLVLPDCELNMFDGILVNMISGYDLTLKQMQEIRERFNGEIFFDVHTFSRGLDGQGKRNFRRIVDFNKWVECINILQTNNEEIKMLSDKSGEAEIVEELISYGIKAVIVTKNETGLSAYLKTENKVELINLPAIEVKVVNKVGCGDVFGAVFFYNYIRYKDIIASLNVANTAAGISATYSNITDFNNLKKDVLKRRS